jgi:hypothetical protein
MSPPPIAVPKGAEKVLSPLLDYRVELVARAICRAPQAAEFVAAMDAVNGLAGP